MTGEQLVEFIDLALLPDVQALVGDSTAVSILLELSVPKRYSEFKLGVSSKTLSSRLKLLEQYGIITRTLHAEVPPRVVYERTQKGAELVSIIQGMLSWERSWRDSNVA